MLTPEKIARHYRGPHQKTLVNFVGLQFSWHQKGKRWPRTSWHLVYFADARRFDLHRATKATARNPSVFSEPETGQIDAFRACLSPEQRAACVRASIAWTAERERGFKIIEPIVSKVTP